jgi:hypothetical protein
MQRVAEARTDGCFYSCGDLPNAPGGSPTASCDPSENDGFKDCYEWLQGDSSVLGYGNNVMRGR